MVYGSDYIFFGNQLIMASEWFVRGGSAEILRTARESPVDATSILDEIIEQLLSVKGAGEKQVWALRRLASVFGAT